MANRAVDLIITYRVVKLLATPFEKQEAFKYGIIDKDGKVLRKFRTLKTTAEKKSYTMLHRFVLNLKRFKYLKRLFRKYKITGNIKVRLAVNHIIVLQNVFGVEAAVTLLLYKVDKNYWSALKSILNYLGYLYPHELDNIKVDNNIDQLLREL